MSIVLNIIYCNKNEYDTIGCHIEYYKNVLFKNFICNICFGYKNINYKSNNIFIIWRKWDEFTTIAKKYNEQNLKFGAIHVGHETFEPNKINWYKYSSFIIKKGFNEKYLSLPNVYYQPMGYKLDNINNNEIKKIIDKNIEKKYIYNYIGTTGGKDSFRGKDRYELINNFLKKDKREHVKIEICNNDKKFSSKEYYTILKKSIFTICPYGKNLETLRHWEAMECNSIPITKNAPFLEYLNNHPFVIVNDYSELHMFFNNVTDEYIKSKQEEIQIWWENKKKDITNSYFQFIKTIL